MSIEKTEEQKPGEESKKETTPKKTEDQSELIKSLIKKVEDLEKREKEPLIHEVKGKDNNSDKEVIRMLLEKMDKNSDKSDFEKFGDGTTFVDNKDIDPDDQLKTPVTFVAHCSTYVITDDIKQGRPVRTPFGKIVFKYDSTKKVLRGRETDLFVFSTYVCSSKKERDWLMNHSLFGSYFFANVNGKRTVSGRRALKLANAIKRLQSVGQGQLLNMARDYGVEVTTPDPSLIRTEIAQLIVEKELAQEDQSSEERAREAIAEEELFKT